MLSKTNLCQIVQTYICAIDTPLYCGFWRPFSLTRQDLVLVSITCLGQALDHWSTCKKMSSAINNAHPKPSSEAIL